MAVNRQKIWQINFNKYNAVGGGLKCCHPLNYKNTTVNQSPPHVGERGNFLWIAQKHTRNTSCILSTVSAKSSYAMPLSTHGATGTGGGKEKYPLNTSHEYLTEEKFYPLSTSDEALKSPYEQYPVTICGQTIILTNGELAAALLSLPEKKREIIYLYFFGNYIQ